MKTAGGIFSSSIIHQRFQLSKIEDLFAYFFYDIKMFFDIISVSTK